MGGSPLRKTRIKPNYRRRVLRLPDLDHARPFLTASARQPQSTSTTMQPTSSSLGTAPNRGWLSIASSSCVYRMYLESWHLVANTSTNSSQPCVAWLAKLPTPVCSVPELAAGISRVQGVKQFGFRSGNWLSGEQSSEVLACQAGLGDVCHAVRVWFSKIGTGEHGIG